MKILVAEDDFGSRRMMQKLLTVYGSVDVVVDGEEAVEAFRLAWEESKPYDIVFMDIMMPMMDGHEALKRIRELEREMGVKPTNEAKVIMTSVLEDPKNVIEAYYGGSATSYLIKPIDREKLEDELDRLGARPQSNK
jgi:two-component system chemotaxis response regulator CheY